jgi:hypothetical protein
LAPSSHSTIYKSRIHSEAFVGPYSEAFHYAGTESLDEDVRV